ncbi:MAG TPA: hypothetical protein ENH07_07830 [Nitrospirae bacterium]|nr:hypothetical protein [Nitrospirota bacterium]
MDRGKSIFTKEVFTAEVIAAGGSAYSSIFDLSQAGGQFSMQLELTGDGTAKVEWVGSNDGTTFLKPNNANDIVTAFIKTGGPGSDGKHIYGFVVSLVKFMKIKVIETSTTDPITVTATLAIQ